MTPSNPTAGAWERLSRYHGGTVAELAAAQDRDGSLIVLAATPVGVYRSTDSGRSWAACGQPGALPFVTSVAPSPAFAEDRTIFAGTLAGLFRSQDGGDSWQPALSGGAVLAVAVSPPSQGGGAVFVGTARDGILRSEDGGNTWAGANAGLLDLTVQALALSTQFHEDGAVFAGTDSGLYRSRNGGKSWQEVDLGLDADVDAVSVQALSVGLRRHGEVWFAAATEEHGLLLSDDGARTWFDAPDLGGRSIAAVSLWATDAGVLGIDVVADQSVLRSVDGGVTWRSMGALLAPALTLLSLTPPADGGEPDMLAGLVSEGVVRIAAAGQAPAGANDGLDATELTMLAFSPTFEVDGAFFAASADGTVLGSRDRGRLLTRLDLGIEVLSVTGLVVSPEFRDDRTVWLSSSDAVLRSCNAGETWELLPFDPPRSSSDVPPDDESGGSPLRLLTVASQDRRPVLFAGRGVTVGRSDDGGERWRWLGAIDDGQEVVGLAALPQRDGGFLLYAATRGLNTSGGRTSQSVWRSTDGGGHWERWLDVEAEGHLSLLGWAGPPSELNLVAAVDGTVFIPRTDARERRGGAARPLWWAVDLRPDVVRITSLSTPVGPQAGHVIYAGTDTGAYVSRDGGRSFDVWHDEGVRFSVLAVAAAPDYATSHAVFASGPGGAIWRRYDR